VEQPRAPRHALVEEVRQLLQEAPVVGEPVQAVHRGGREADEVAAAGPRDVEVEGRGVAVRPGREHPLLEDGRVQHRRHGARERVLDQAGRLPESRTRVLSQQGAG